MSATNRGAKRKVNDAYDTPEYTIDSLLEVLRISRFRTFLEPCKGNNRIYDKIDVLPMNKQWCEITQGKDYLTTYFNDVDLIITNPPFNLAQEFLQKSLIEAASVWYLLRLNFLESKKRVKFWEHNPPTHLLVLSARPSFTGKGTDATGYAWFGWDYNNTCKLSPGVHMLPYNK